MDYKEALEYISKYTDYLDIENDPDYSEEEILRIGNEIKKRLFKCPFCGQTLDPENNDGHDCWERRMS